MKHIHIVTLTLFIAGAFIFSACNNEPGETSNGGGPVLSRKPERLMVINDNNLVQQWDDAASSLEFGGWYEKADAPDTAKAATVDYDKIDPKKFFSVRKYYGYGEDEEPAELDDYTVVVLEGADGALTPKQNTKLEELGPTKIKIVYKEDPTVSVSYYNIDGTALENQDYVEVMVAKMAAPPGATLAGFTIQRLPVKTVYDWKEQFDPSGLEVVKWYGNGTSLQTGGEPVIATAEDYDVDSSAYSNEFKPNEITGEQPAMPTTQVSKDFQIVVKGKDGSSGTPADFTIKRVPKEYKISFTAANGEAISGGAISSAPTTAIAGNTVTLTFRKNVNTQLNPESVSIRYQGLEIRPVKFGSSSSNQLEFVWPSASYEGENLKITADAITANFRMPTSDVVVTADFVYQGTNLRNLEVSNNGTAYTQIYGFSPNIKRYDYVILNAQESVYLKVTTDATTTQFAVDETGSDSPGALIAASDKQCAITGIGVGDTMILITTSIAGGESITKFVIKRFNDANEIKYKFIEPLGGVQSFMPPVNGKYKFTAWGAYGGNSVDRDDAGKYGPYATGQGGRGAKSEGTLEMDLSAVPWNPATDEGGGTTAKANIVYVYVGEGGWGRQGYTAGRATYNGGGAGGAGGAYGAGSGGGGATSISLTRGAWSDWQVLIDRILVAGGGGGYGHNGGKGGAAGGLIAQGGCVTSYETGTAIGDVNPVTYYGPTTVHTGWFTGATQYIGSGRGGQGFGIGGLGPSPPGYGGSGAEGRGGGGGGYFGGEVSWGKVGGASNAGGGGGSGYVSGHAGCIAYKPISSPSWLVQLDQSSPDARPKNPAALTAGLATHYSGRTFTTGSTSMTEHGNSLTVDTPNFSSDGYSPVPNPFGAENNVGTLGAKNRDGILIIKYMP